MEPVLLIVNTKASTVSPRKRDVIVKALSADVKLELAETAGRRHASSLARDAVERGFAAVIAFGGDGTVNEVAQALVGTDVALGILPGGMANVVARTTGMPLDPVEATAFVAARLKTRSCRRINVGRMGEHYFLFGAGIGFDAEVVRQMEEDPDFKRRWGDWAFVSRAVRTALTQYRGADPSITLEVPGREPERVVLGVVANARPFTYFKGWPVDACPEARLDAGLDVLALRRVTSLLVARLAWSLLVSRSHVRWRGTVYHHDLNGCRLSADRPLPVQADGEYIGERSALDVDLTRDGLDLLV